MSESSPLSNPLYQTLLSLHTNPYPTLANPPNCSRRASVALIIRIRPSYSSSSSSSPPPSSPSNTYINNPASSPDLSFTDHLTQTFSQPWVQSGQPEILFIKRAARRTDRWTSHIALPGGKRDPEDISDAATAERETFEEVGLTITSLHRAGPLPQRVVTTDFGAVPLMVLCPYVYLLSDAEVGRVRLQPTEVSSAHWVPIAALLDPSARTYERADIVDRFASRWGKTARTVLGWSLGQALYAAVRLRPSESLFSAESETRSSEAMTSNRGGVWTRLREVIREDTFSTLSKWGIAEAEPDDSRRLLLWGLTHGITCDFLGLLPTAKGLDWWRWPTLSRSDVRFVVWIVSYRFRKVKSDAVRMGKMSDVNSPVIIGEGLGTKSLNQSSGASRSPATIYSAAGFLLDGYFEQIQKAVYICFVLRFLFGSAGVWYLIRRYQRNR